MSAHNHRTVVMGCFRCELSADEAKYEMDQLLKEARKINELDHVPITGLVHDLADALESTTADLARAREIIEKIRLYLTDDSGCYAPDLHEILAAHDQEKL